jgi:spermidine/putrescine transport system substrate-binding protein
MLTEMRDSVGLVMLGMGNDPARDGQDAALEAIQKIKQASDDGQIRRFTGNDFTRDLLKGDAWASVAWSGDSIQLKADNPDIRFLRPEEGTMLFSDNMMIPVGAPHAYTAQKMMDFVYDPRIQAGISAYVNYVTPVKGVKEILAESDPELAEEPLIFPSEADLEKLRIFRSLSPKEDDQLSKAFQAVVGA